MEDCLWCLPYATKKCCHEEWIYWGLPFHFKNFHSPRPVQQIPVQSRRTVTTRLAGYIPFVATSYIRTPNQSVCGNCLLWRYCFSIILLFYFGNSFHKNFKDCFLTKIWFFTCLGKKFFHGILQPAQRVLKWITQQPAAPLVYRNTWLICPVLPVATSILFRPPFKPLK